MAITPPTFIQEAETPWNSTTSPKTTASFDVKAGDVLVAIGVTEDNSTSISSITGGALTWTQVQVVSVASNTWASIWTATVDADKSMTVSFTRSASANWFGGNVLTFRGSSGIGKSAKTNAEGAPSLSFSTEAEGSAIVGVCGDWKATDGAGRTWRTINSNTPTSGNGLERTYFRDSSIYTVYGAYWSDVGVAGSKTTGLSAPSGQKYSIVAVEVKGEESKSEPVDLVATLTGSGSLVAELRALTPLAGNLSGTGAVAAELRALTSLAADLGGTGSVAGELVSLALMAADLGGQGSATGVLLSIADLEGVLGGSGTLAAELRHLVSLEGGLEGIGTLVALLEEALPAGPPRGDLPTAAVLAAVGARVTDLAQPSATAEIASSGCLASLYPLFAAIGAIASEGTTAALTGAESRTTILDHRAEVSIDA